MPTETETITVCRAAELPEGSMRLVEAGERKIGVFHCAGGELVRDRGPLLARRRAARRGGVRPGGVYRRVPPPRLAVRPADRQAPGPSPPTGRCETFAVRIDDDEVKLEL